MIDYIECSFEVDDNKITKVMNLSMKKRYLKVQFEKRKNQR